MSFFMGAGLFFLLFSLMFFFAPNLIVKLSQLGNKMIFTDHGSVAHRRFTGFALFLMSILMFYIGVTLF